MSRSGGAIGEASRIGRIGSIASIITSLIPTIRIWWIAGISSSRIDPGGRVIGRLRSSSSSLIPMFPILMIGLSLMMVISLITVAGSVKVSSGRRWLRRRIGTGHGDIHQVGDDPIVAESAALAQVAQVVLTFDVVTAGDVEGVDGVVRLHSLLFDQVPGNQISGAVQSVGTVDHQNMTVGTAAAQERVNSSEKLANCLSAGNDVALAEHFGVAHAAIGKNFGIVVTTGGSQIDDESDVGHLFHKHRGREPVFGR